MRGFKRVLAAAGFVAIISTPTWAAEVWRSTFDSGTDGVVDIRTENGNKAMIGANTGGRLDIVIDERSGIQGDSAGRALGSTVGANHSFSGLYKFNYSSLANGPEGVEGAVHIGFTGGASLNIAQVMGTRLLRRSFSDGTQEFTLTGHWSGNRTGPWTTGLHNNTSFTIPESELIGKELLFAVGYDGSTKVLRMGLYDAALAELLGDDPLALVSPAAQFSRDIRTFETVTGSGATPAQIQTEMDSLALTHLGWLDGWDNDVGRMTWSTDTLAYFNTADGAFNAIPEPVSGVMMFVGLTMMALRRRRAV